MAVRNYSNKELWEFIFGDDQPRLASKVKVRTFSKKIISGVTELKSTVKTKDLPAFIEKNRSVINKSVGIADSDVDVLERPKEVNKTSTPTPPKQKKKSKKQLRQEKRNKTKKPPLVVEKPKVEEIEEIIEPTNITETPVTEKELGFGSDDSWGSWDIDVEEEVLTVEEESAVEELIEETLVEEVVEKPIVKEVVVEEPEIDDFDTDDVGLKSLKEDVHLTKEAKKEDLTSGLKKTKLGFFAKIGRAIAGKTKISEADLDDIEEALISSDVSLDTTIKIIERLEERVAKDKFLNASELNSILKEEIVDLLSENNVVDLDDFVIPGTARPYVMMVVGVNGVGKTTTIGKLAHHFKQRGHKVVLGAGDTFRAAAVDQLKIWAKRSGVDIVEKGMDADPSSVAFDTMVSAQAKGADIVLLDTAGRLHNKKGLMEELSKIKRVMSKHIPEAPHDVMLVLDGSTGQNALEQAKQFSEFTQVSSLAITKLDGTAKGGVVIAIADQLKIPIRYIGVGEKANHLQVFNKAAFVNTLFD